jgi:hypothetical protein
MQQQSRASGIMPAKVAQQQPMDLGSTPPTAAVTAAAVPGGLSSFQEISRMISQGDTNSPLARPGSIKTSLAPGHAARLLDEQGSWGTPQENSPWGTPREQQLGSNANNTPNSGNADQPGQQHSHHHNGPALHKLVFGGEQLHSRLEAVVSGEQEQPQQHGGKQLQQLDHSSQGAVSKPAADAATDLEPAAVVAAAVAAVDAAAATAADGFDDMDFTIPVAMDVQPRPQSRNSSRFRDMYRVSCCDASWSLSCVPTVCSTRACEAEPSPTLAEAMCLRTSGICGLMLLVYLLRCCCRLAASQATQVLQWTFPSPSLRAKGT